MNPVDYLFHSAATDVPDYNVIRERLAKADDKTLQILHASFGVTTEAGEIADAYKKFLFYGKPLDNINLREEVGDVLWYLALLLRAIDSDFETTMQINIDKLRARYPSKFDEHAALNRNLEAERAILEQKPTLAMVHGFDPINEADFSEDGRPCPILSEADRAIR